jgi:hypothetical protein
VDVSFLRDRRERPLGSSAWLKERGEVARVSHPRNFQFESPEPRISEPLAVAIALARASGAALVMA